MTNNLTPRPEVRGAIVGVDTHKHIHVAVAIDTCGIHLGDQSFAADSGGYQALLMWAETHGRIQAFGIEGTGGYGVGLARAVRRAGHRVVEVNRADRRLRRVAGKSDRIDAEAVALGLQACAHGVRVLFATATGLIATLGKAFAEGRLDERLKLLVQPQLLIIDEIGYIPIDRQGANLFFQLVSRRYERGAIILTSNQSLGAWGDVFGDPVIATAILDRLLHHSVTVNIRGDSYRLREKMKAGLLKSKTTMSAATA